MVSKEIINAQYLEAKQKFPKLNQPEQSLSGWFIKGSIDVIDDEGSYWDTYEVSIAIPKEYPNRLPQLYETGKKIERHEDWHNAGVCCLSTEAIIFSTLHGRFTLLNWIEKFAHPFLANHIVKLKTGEYAKGEFEHGTKGIIQGYYKLFNVGNVGNVINKLKFFLEIGIKFSRNKPCFCGSKKRHKECFIKEPEKHTGGIPLGILRKDLDEIEAFLKKTKVG